MQSLLIVFIAVTWAVQCCADEKRNTHELVRGKAYSIPVVEPVKESEPIKTCPPKFKLVGDHCAQKVTASATPFCPPTFVRTVDNSEVCAKFYEKVITCPPEFNREKSACIRMVRSDALVECPEGFTLSNSKNYECSRTVVLPHKLFCPLGSHQHGDVCIKNVTVEPNLICPEGFRFEEDRCVIMETYDCTPYDKDTVEESDSRKQHHKKPLFGFHSAKKHSTDEEFVVQKTCKRVHTEAPRKICPKRSHLHGKECIAEKEVPFQEKDGGFKTEIVKAKLLCPSGFFPSSAVGHFHCLMKEEVPIHAFCPQGLEDIGHKCARYRPILLRCPKGYGLDNNLCSKVLLVAPTVEFSVSFRCTGKDCDHMHHPVPKYHS